MKKYKLQSNWVVQENIEDMIIADDTINKIVDFEKNILNRYITREEYKVYIDICQDVDFVVHSKEKFEQILTDENVISDVSADSFDDEIRFFINREENQFKIRR